MFAFKLLMMIFCTPLCFVHFLIHGSLGHSEPHLLRLPLLWVISRKRKKQEEKKHCQVGYINNIARFLLIICTSMCQYIKYT